MFQYNGFLVGDPTMDSTEVGPLIRTSEVQSMG